MPESAFLDLSPLGSCVSLFDLLGDVSFFIKDPEGRYAAVNQTMVDRLGRGSKADLIGKTAIEVWGEKLGRVFHQQDLEAMERQRPVRERLQRHAYPDRPPGWCLTSRVPLRDRTRRVIGLVGVSRDLHHDAEDDAEFALLADALDWAEASLDQSIRIPDLAARAELSVWRLEQRLLRIHRMNPAQWLTLLRMDRARDLLRHSDLSVQDIARACGYADHSAFTRQFRQQTGMPPSAWRDQVRRDPLGG